MLLVLGIGIAPAGGRAAAFPNGLHCGDSPYAYGDILPEGPGPGTLVIRIARIMTPQWSVVGYAYRMQDGVVLIQLLPGASAQTMRILNLTPLQLRRLPPWLPDGLRIKPCPPSLLIMQPGLKHTKPPMP